ncbi:MAG: protein-tyrosine phosphatase family protein [Acidimicrobiales bacterium]
MSDMIDNSDAFDVMAEADARDSDPTAFTIDFDPRSRRMSGRTQIGNHWFDVPFITAITESLWVGGCHEGLVLPEQVDHLVSLYPWERYTVNHHLLTKLEVRLHDSDSLPVEEEVVYATARWVNDRRRTGLTLVHCQAGLNRSNLVVALALMLEGSSAAAAIQLLRDRRSPAVLCNPRFEAWLRDQDGATS